MKKGLRSIITLIKTGRKERKCCRAGQSKKKEKEFEILCGRKIKRTLANEKVEEICASGVHAVYIYKYEIN